MGGILGKGGSKKSTTAAPAAGAPGSKQEGPFAAGTKDMPPPYVDPRQQSFSKPGTLGSTATPEDPFAKRRVTTFGGKPI
jgi:hypothetical protein